MNTFTPPTLACAIVAVGIGLSAGLRSQVAGPETAATHHRRGVDFHNQRRLDEASLEYARALLLDPPRSYDAAVRLVADQVRGPMRLRESHGPFSSPEGADFEVTLEHLQPWEVVEHRALQHSHAFHMRYYHSALSARGLDRVRLRTRAGDRSFYRVAASAHYEVEHTNPNHADVEICPICGRTGEYTDLRGNLVELVHDPLGLELLLYGTIRKELVRFEDDERAVGGITALRNRFAVDRHVFAAQRGDRNTLRIGVVVLSAPR